MKPTGEQIRQWAIRKRQQHEDRAWFVAEWHAMYGEVPHVNGRSIALFREKLTDRQIRNCMRDVGERIPSPDGQRNARWRYFCWLCWRKMKQDERPMAHGEDTCPSS